MVEIVIHNCREEKDLLSMVLDEIPDYPSNSATPLLRSADIVNLSARQRMQQELQNSRESVLQMEQLHQQDIAKLKETLEAVKTERRNERGQLQQKINSLQKVLKLVTSLSMASLMVMTS